MKMIPVKRYISKDDEKSVNSLNRLVIAGLLYYLSAD